MDKGDRTAASIVSLWWKFTISMAAKAELNTVKTDLETNIAEVKADLKADVAEIKSDITGMRADLKGEIGELRADISESRQLLCNTAIQECY